ncbi:U3 small nucleolar RNA-associated protein 10 [Leucoagaricus sp. SymC.cos]|nr:U3 small nucleolar RNA-associated protein 10 [Leucoagaricus sp. SymC.cos]
MSSLATQLAQSASLNAALLADRSKRKPSESYLFTGRDADQHDLDSIFALGTNAFLKLCSVDQRLKRYEHELFSDRARAVDRTLLGKEEDEKLGGSIAQFLGLLGPWLLEAPTARVIEWLVRRFRIHEFNVENLLALFLPYHDTAQFAKLVTILHVKPSSTWSFLLPFKSAAQNVPRVSLVTEMLRNTDVARFITSLLPSALKENRSHRVLLAFNAATLHEFIFRSKALSEGTMAYLLPALLEPLEKKRDALRDAVLGSFILLSALSQKCELSASALKVIIGSMASCTSVIATKQFISATIAVCEPQTELDSLSSSTIKTIFQLPDIKEELKATIGWVGSEKLVRPLVTALVSRLSDDNASVLLESIISMPAVPSPVTEHATTLLVRGALSDETPETATAARSLLSVIQQRHPDTFQRVIKIEQDEEDDLKQAIDQLVLSLSIVTTSSSGSKDKTDMALASTNADTNVRLIAVKQLLSSLSKDELTSADKEYIASALISRAQDTEYQILEALYEKPDLVVPLFASSASAYIKILSTSLGSKPKRSLLRLHLAFALGQLYPTLESKLKEQLISEVLFPFLLFSKPRQHTAETVWDIVAETMAKEEGQEFEILKGCTGVVKAEREKAVDDVVEKMKSTNAALTGKIAQNILMSNHLYELLPVLSSKLESSNPHTRALGYLITKELLGKLSGRHQVDVARRILDVMKLEEISGIDDLPADHDQFLETLQELPQKNVIFKPTKSTTLSWLQVSLIAVICAISPPDGLILNWLSDQPSSSMPDTRGSQYVSLMRAVYNLANRSSSLPVLTSCLLRILFLNLKSEALAFLAGVWTTENPSSSTSAEYYSSLQEIALRHAAAFLEAHVLEDDGVDFQTVVPALLIALQNNANGVRKAAAECLNRIRLISERKLKRVYKFDIVYGDVKDTLQYLEQDDLKHYIGYLVAHQQHFLHDPTYLRVAHAEHLKPAKGDRKKDIEYKSSVLYYLLSHVNALALDSNRIRVLEALSLVSSAVKALTLLPSIEALKNQKCNTTLAALLVASFDLTSLPQLNDAEGELWDVYMQTLKMYLQPSSDSKAREVLLGLLETELFAKLVYEKQIVVCEVILGVVARDVDAQSYGKKLLSSMLKDVPLIIELLNTHAPALQGTSPRAAKRVKITGPSSSEDTLPELSLFAEILGSKPLPGSLDLVQALLETLSKVIQCSPPSQADVNYVEQMLMSAVDSAASNISEAPNMTPSVIRLDVLVEVIRVVGNPQTFHQALLLMASLARLAPESVLHNVMPVFTFMGSNVFHRDDTYSFRVVQKTIDGIVPVMASSLKDANANSLDLYIASRDFLRVFTDAANHIPRHRRNNFFTHLIEVLGVEHFIAPVCMLLAEKSTNRIVRQSQNEASSTLSLPVALLQHVPPSIRISALVEFLRESQRLATSAADPANHIPALLDHTIDGELTVSASTCVKRAQALVTLIDQGIQPNTLTNLDEAGKKLLGSLVSGLIVLASVSDQTSGVKFSGLATAAHKALNKVLSAMPAPDFVQVILFMLDSETRNIQIGALELLSERVPKIAGYVRREVATTTSGIVESMVKLLAQDNMRLRTNCLKALKSLASTMVSKEESALTTALPAILAALKVPELVHHALDSITPLSSKLGPRIIPFFKDIVVQSVVILKDADDDLLEKTTAVLHGLLSSVPAFWGSDAITQMVNLYMDHVKANSGHSRAAMSSLMKAISKKVPTKDRVTAYSEFLEKTLRHAARASVIEQARNLSNIFMQALDIAKVSDAFENKAEARVISAFREFVVKLNETAFRPVFRRMYDWAFVNDPADRARKITFFHTYCALLDYFKALMVPYTSFLLQTFDTHLKSLAESSDESSTLWTSLVTTLTKTLTYDDGGFWRDDKLREISVPLIQQIPFCSRFSTDSEPRLLLQPCLDALIEDVSDDALLKNINLDLLMHTRSESPKVRHFALVCSESLWRAHGGRLMGFVSETATFIAECAEDENDLVVKESFRLKEAVESVAGRIDRL